MLQWFGHLAAAHDSPTADLYFADACAGAASVKRLGPTVFAGAKATLVARHAARTAPSGPLVYLIDDDVPAGLEDPTLPLFYRQKLAALEAPCWRRMLRSADLWVVGSDALAERVRSGPPIRRLDPFWREPMADLDHHDGDGPLDIVFLGSSVHRADLALVLPAVEAVLHAEPRARFLLAERHALPPALSRHPRVHRLPGRRWTAYRSGMAGRRFHIALYPLLQTRFNRARSVNKLIEHGVVGAAPIYSRWWPEGARAAGAGAGLSCANEPEAWRRAILSLLRDPDGRRGMAAEAQRLARRLNRPQAQRALWQELLGVCS